ncbi:hydroxyproline-rich glycoprotein family protein, partial [Reticulomyxa filosa]
FRDAAGAFKHLAGQDESIGLACTLDIQKDSANMLATLMLAQAQACFFEMVNQSNLDTNFLFATKKKTSPGLLSKLAMGTAQLFEKTYQMVTVNEGLKNWLSKGTYTAEYWQSHVDLKSGKEGCYGLEIARLNNACKYLESASQLSKKVVPALEESRKNLYDRY